MQGTNPNMRYLTTGPRILTNWPSRLSEILEENKKMQICKTDFHTKYDTKHIPYYYQSYFVRLNVEYCRNKCKLCNIFPLDINSIVITSFAPTIVLFSEY